MTKPTTQPMSQESSVRRFQGNENQLSDPVSLYLDSLASSGRRSVRSLLQSAALIIGFTGALEQMPWNQIEYQHLAVIRNTLKKQGKSANTINLSIAAIRGVMSVCFNLKLIDADQLQLINTVKAVRSQRLPSGRCLSSSDIKKLYRACQRDQTSAGIRDQALIALMLGTGLRRSEVISLNIDDYNSRTGLLTIQHGKGDKQRIAYLNSDSRKIIRQWQKQRGNQSGSLFNPVNKTGKIVNRQLTSQSVYDIVKQRSAQANIGTVRPHDLRRTFVTRLLEAGVDMNTTRQLAGHSDIQTTARYDLRDVKSQKKAVKLILY